MTAFASLDEVVNRASGGNSGLPELLFMHKEWRSAGAVATLPVVGRYHSNWLLDGSPSGGSTPGAAAVPTNATAGGMMQANPGGGRQKWNLSSFGLSSAAGTLILYDRLLHCGGFDGTVTTAQTVGGALTRYTGGIGNVLWAEVYTQIGASSTTVTASYTNQNGTAAQVTQAVAIGNTGLREQLRIIPLSLAAGDNGVQACASATLAATTGTAGSWGITIAHPLLAITTGSGLGAIRSFVDGPMNEILTNACLAWVWVANTVSALPFDVWAFNVER
jgi:hypothetical protein